ncbi:MAG: hypothetical protein QXU09_00260 [Thermoproteota archaeon]
MNLESIRWELKKLFAFPIPEIMIASMIFNGTIMLPSLMGSLSSEDVGSLESYTIIYFFAKQILYPVVSFAFVIQGILMGVITAIILPYERESGMLDTELAYSRNRTELFAAKLIALILFGIICLFTSTIVLLVYNLRGAWLVETFFSFSFSCFSLLIQTIFIISLNVLISTVSDRTVISILSSALIFYSLDNLIKYSNLQPGSFLYNIPPISTSKFLIVPHEAVNNLIATFTISLGFLLIAFIYFTRFYEVK